jgi:hypothetical protein
LKRNDPHSYLQKWRERFKVRGLGLGSAENMGRVARVIVRCAWAMGACVRCLPRFLNLIFSEFFSATALHHQAWIGGLHNGVEQSVWVRSRHRRPFSRGLPSWLSTHRLVAQVSLHFREFVWSVLLVFLLVQISLIQNDVSLPHHAHHHTNRIAGIFGVWNSSEDHYAYAVKAVTEEDFQATTRFAKARGAEFFCLTRFLIWLCPPQKVTLAVPLGTCLRLVSFSPTWMAVDLKSHRCRRTTSDSPSRTLAGDSCQFSSPPPPTLPTRNFHACKVRQATGAALNSFRKGHSTWAICIALSCCWSRLAASKSNVTLVVSCVRPCIWQQKTSNPTSAGHDWYGRSTAAGSLMLWTHLRKHMVWNDAYVPTGCTAEQTDQHYTSAVTGAPGISAVTVGSGVQFYDLYVVGSLVIGSRLELAAPRRSN